ncbi:hypothetical protein AB0E88_30330 [Streptomyces sp. NPDC028635]|uniref:hypothetical protein n=1 Tax=Streptomyces sp. NPDC028635 TaxID=3154800 RepID=UPI0033F50623
MGTDIDGVIECRAHGQGWRVECDVLDLRLGRHYDAWGCLFAVHGSEDIDRPLFADRGLPDDVCDVVRETSGGDWQHGHTYATWADVKAADWEAPVIDGPARYWAAEWREGGHGLVLHDVVRATPDLADAAADTFGGHVLLVPAEWPPGGEVRLDGVVYRPVVLTARMLAPPDEEPWDRLWRTMRDLAAVHGDDDVRLVVWFG